MYEITNTPSAGQATGNDTLLAVLGGRCFMRVAVKNAMSADAQEVRWLVGELNGVRLYLMRELGGQEVSIVMTTEDLYA